MIQEEQRVILPDGRRLGFATFGSPEGMPVVYCHGFPASRLEAQILSEAAAQLNITLIAPDRPGIGGSDFQPGRRITDWPQDLKKLADDLDLDRFAVLAVSGGAPYALACAHHLPERITQVKLVSAMGPAARPELARSMRQFSRFGLAFARDRQDLAAEIFQAFSPLLLRHPRFAFRIKETSKADQRALDRDAIRSILFQSVQEAVRQGGRGIALDLALLARPWGFALEDITTPVRLWHGLDDKTVPAVMSEFLADALPNATLSLLPGEGHVSLSVDHAEDILRMITEGAVSAEEWKARTFEAGASLRDQPRSR